MNKVIFIAVPSKGVVADGKLKREFLQHMAQLTIQNPQLTFISPMVQDYQLLEFMPGTTATWVDWGKHCKALIERSDEIWVLMYEGWDTSTGVAGEIEHAKLNEKPVKYVIPVYGS